MNWYFEVLKKYAVFSGRARRKEYWMFVLFNFIFIIFAALYLLEKSTGIRTSSSVGRLWPACGSLPPGACLSGIGDSRSSSLMVRLLKK